jgi:RHS repeat-associated protein
MFVAEINNNPGMGRLTGFSNDGSTGSVTYDAVGNITSQSETIGAKSYTTQYQYDNNNRLSKIIYAPSGHIVSYMRNSLGQITAVQWQASATAPIQTLVSGVTYLPFGPIQSLTYGNGAVTTLQYDSDYRMTRSTTTSNPVRDIVYAYNSAGNITSLTDQANTYTKTFGYDALDRLVTDNNDAGQYSYQYDANGNRTQTSSVNSSGSATVPITYSAGTNRMATLNGLPVSYDANGNITSEYGYQGYTYNNANRLASSTITAGTQTMVTGSYSYNAFGRRVINNTETHYLYMPDGKYLVKPVWGNGTVPFQRSEYIYLDNMPVAQVYESLNSNGTVASTTLTYVLADHLGTPRLMMDATKKVVWRWEGDAYGQSFPIQSTDSTTGLYDFLDLRFPGQMADNGNTSYYNINRYFDPLVGAYTQPDLIGLSGGVNRFAYSRANPLRFFDFLGLEYSCVGAPASQAAACDYLKNKERALERADEERALCHWDEYYKALADAARWDWMYLNALGQQLGGTSPEPGTPGGNGDTSEPERPQPPTPQITDFNVKFGPPPGI